MSAQARTTMALFIIVSMATLCVEGYNFKRHYDTKPVMPSPNPGKQQLRPRADEPLCRQVCRNVNAECRETCVPDAASPALFTTTVPEATASLGGSADHSSKYECINSCMNPDDDNLFVIEEENCAANPSDLSHAAGEEQQQVVGQKRSEEVEIDVLALTMEDRCHMEAFRNTSACRLDREDPTVSKKVFNVNKPKLTLCTGAPVLSSKRGLITKEGKSFSKEQIRTDATRVRNVRSAGFGGRNRYSDGDEFCPTMLNYESPSTAIHLTTEKIVDLYFYAGYSQWFEMGACKLDKPRKPLGDGEDGFESHCDVSMTAVKAWIIFDPKKFDDISNFQGCGTIKNHTYMICNDWVRLPTHCKHFYRLA